MFLNQLSHQEKKMFLDLSVHIANANDELAIEEKAMLNEYCTEMQLPPIELFETQPFETVADYFAMTSEKVKRIVMLEILGLVYVDGSFDEDESTLTQKFARKIGIDDDTYAALHKAIQEYYRMCAKMAAVIEGG